MQALHRRGFWAGVALATPFLAEFLSWKYASLLLIPFIASVIITRPRLASLPPVLTLAVFLAVVHVLALHLTYTPFAFQVFKDLCIFALLLGIFLMAGEEATDGFFAVLVPLGVVTALVGLVKVAMLDRGYLFGPLLDSCSNYPGGTSLCLDYNVLGLLWLLAMIGAMRSRWWPFAAILLAAGMLSGSRRFLLLMPFLPIAWALLERRKALLKIVVVAVAGLALSSVVTSPKQYLLYQHKALPWTVLDWTGARPTLEMQGPGRTYAGVMLGTMSAESGYGAGSRLDRWKFGAQGLNFFGSGFKYHTEFSCKFVKCKFLDYPHMPVISEWLIGGVVAGIVALGFYVGLLCAAWKRRRIIPTTALLLTMPYALISGDTVFSVPQMMAVGMVVLLVPTTRKCSISSGTSRIVPPGQPIG